MNAEQFIEENYFGLKIDCPRDIHTIYQALEDYANEQLRLYGVVKSLPQDNFCKVCNLPTDGKKCYSKRCPV